MFFISSSYRTRMTLRMCQILYSLSACAVNTCYLVYQLVRLKSKRICMRSNLKIWLLIVRMCARSRAVCEKSTRTHNCSWRWCAAQSPNWMPWPGWVRPTRWRGTSRTFETLPALLFFYASTLPIYLEICDLITVNLRCTPQVGQHKKDIKDMRNH